MDDYYDKVTAELLRLDRWQFVAFAAACAERIALIFRSFGSPESVRLYEEGLEMAWRGVTQKEVAAEAQQLIKEFEATPEGEEDPEIFTYHYAQRALAILTYALEAIVRNHVEPATWSCGEGLNFRSALDDLLRDESLRLKPHYLSDAPPPGPLEVLELKHQRETLELIKSVHAPNSELISSLRRFARDANKDLELAVSEIRKGRR